MAGIDNPVVAYEARCDRCLNPGPFERLLHLTQAIAVEFTVTVDDAGQRTVRETIPEDAQASEEDAGIGGYRCAGCGHVHDRRPIWPVRADHR